jgi:hypothetical protein
MVASLAVFSFMFVYCFNFGVLFFLYKRVFYGVYTNILVSVLSLLLALARYSVSTWVGMFSKRRSRDYEKMSR